MRKITPIGLRDVIYLVAAIICFAEYAHKASTFAKVSSSQQIAELHEGEVQRKSVGNPTFSLARPGEKLFNRDVIWVQDSPWAQIKFLDGSILYMRQGTLLILSRSLKAPQAGGMIDLLSGEVQLEKRWSFPWEASDYEVNNRGKKIKLVHNQMRINADSQEEQAPSSQTPALPQASASSPEPTPSSSASEEPSPAPPKTTANIKIDPNAKSVHPKDGSILLRMTGKSAPIAFIWPELETGTLEIKTTDGENVTSKPIAGLSQTQVELSVEKDYTWGIKSENGAFIYGPYEFKVYSTAKHPLSGLIKNSSKAIIEMVQ